MAARVAMPSSSTPSVASHNEASLPARSRQPSTPQDSTPSSSHVPAFSTFDTSPEARNKTSTTLRVHPRLLETHSDLSNTSYTTSGSEREPPAGATQFYDTPEKSRQSEEGGWHMRHGWDSQYSAEQLRELTTNFYMYFNDKRHETNGNPKDDIERVPTQDWRMRDRLKTVSAILAICLNIGVDPPDVIKTNPCARLECWIDPTVTNGPPGNQPINAISKALQNQYEQLSMRTRYKPLPDPTVDETKKFCTTLRRNAKDERILFHYNGHGVPKPTPSGEIWVFNKNYTQYIPISLYDLQGWIGAPGLFVYDCADAGVIIEQFNKFVDKHESENTEIKRKDPAAHVSNFRDCIQLGACREGEILPTNPLLPADLFTSCLTTPIDIAVRFFIMRNPLPSGLTPEDAARIPGRAQERRTPIGELNWIFTAITDTIAWNCLPKPLFKKLFRQDLMVAALFRNFLLAQRIMRIYHCHPVSHPEIPSCHDHPLWDSWDLAIDVVLAQLPSLFAAEQKQIDYQYQHSDFFYEQLTAFEVYLGQGAIEQKEPEQLPIVLQVLLSQVHRLRALILLSKFLDLGPWAVNLALGIGIFPYVLKLLQSQAIELKPVMVFIWARILAVDQGPQNDLIKDNGYQYFVNILNPVTGMPIREVSEHRAMCAFIISMFCKDYREAQVAVSQSAELVESCLSQTSWQETENPLLRQWSCLCLSMLWKGFVDAKWSGIRSSAHHRLCDIAWDPVPEVRAAMLYALTTFLGIPELTDQVIAIEEGVAARVISMTNDGSALVRKELVIFLSHFIQRHQHRFVVSAYENLLEEKLPIERAPTDKIKAISEDTVYSTTWKHLLILSVDPDSDVARDAAIVVDYVLTVLARSPLGPYAQQAMETILQRSQNPKIATFDGTENVRPISSGPPSPPTLKEARADGYFSLSLKRTASVAASLKSLAFGNAATTPGRDDPPDSPGSVLNERQGHSSRQKVPAEWLQPVDESSSRDSGGYHQAKFPGTKNIGERTNKEKETLPLKSTFYDWSVEYFREPQMKQAEADEPGSMDYNERLWRRNRNERILEATQKLKEAAGSSRWDTNVGYFDNGMQPLKLCFHQYDNQLVVTDERDTVRIWDWERQKTLNKFSNGNPRRSKITGTQFINEDDQALLMTGSSDGVIKLFRNYESEEKNHVVSSFRALTDLVPSTHNAGLIFDWLQGRGWILVAGDAKVIRVWNAATEICTNDIPARSGSCVTSLTSDQVEGNIFVAGFGDGAVRVYDQREKPVTSRIQQWKEHTSWITNVHMQRGGQRELVTGCRNGEVKLWDIRMAKSVNTIRATKDTMRSLSVHEHAPVFATGSERHNIKVYNMSGAFLSSSDPYSSFLHQNRSTPIAATAFHPHRMMLACAAMNDHHISLFSCAEVRKRYTVDGS